tara:strand:+ start:3058 stop:3387 length:330 start_codon:yes stop_codon:yes gene_type:complete
MSYFKTKPVRSKNLRDSARDQECTVRLPGCLFSGETVVLAHLPHSGRGIARKASDLDAVFACKACHDVIDGRTRYEYSREELLEALIRAHSETMQAWADDGLITVMGAA